MPGDFWEDLSEDLGFSWDDVEAIHVVRGDDGWDLYTTTEDGEMIPVVEGMGDDDFQDLFWDELYYWAGDNDIDVDREIDYAPE